MRLRTGLVILSLWCGLNFLVAAAVTVLTLMGRPPPALGLVMTAEQIARADPIAIAVVNTQAEIANPLIMAFCTLVLFLLWGTRGPTAFRMVAATTIFVQIFGFVSDGFIGHTNLIANGVSTALLLTGLALTTPGAKARAEFLG